MFNFIIGELVTKIQGQAVVECNGIGFEFQVSNNTLSALPLNGEMVKIYTFLNVFENGICLYGFATIEEKEMFNKLTTVSGIGPKSALTILSGISLSDLIVAISTGDLKMLCTIKGLGKKTAERLVVELKDKISVFGCSKSQEPVVEIKALDDAVEALVSLGVNKNDAYRLAKANANENSTIEQIVTNVLRGLG
ncbi:MAG: Holliday junction branch migration protein RuvA [Clostridia bacterium]